MLSRVWNSAMPTSTHKLVLLAFADSANDEGMCWPSIKRVATRSQVSGRQVQRVVADLKHDGLLVVLKSAAGHRTSIYLIRGDRLTPLRCDDVAGVAPGVTNEAARGDTHIALGVTHVTQTVSGTVNRTVSPNGCC